MWWRRLRRSAEVEDEDDALLGVSINGGRLYGDLDCKSSWEGPTPADFRRRMSSGQNRVTGEALLRAPS